MPETSTLTLACDRPGTALNAIWSFGANTCHAPLWLRDDLLHHIELSRRELGFRHFRCHDWLGQNMVKPAAGGGWAFARLHQALDRVLALGCKPFFNLCSMPEGMSRDDQHLSTYRFRSSPPADWSRWYGLMRDLMASLAARYGLPELRAWHFEVWNEPDINYWTGTQAEYFKLYDLAARAVKECDPALKVGGPATARTAWIREFCQHVAAPSADFGLAMPRCDFISTHVYPSDLAFLDRDQGEVKLQHSNVMGRLFAAARSAIDGILGKEMPLICGEWNSSAGPMAANHDTCNNGAFIVKTMLDLAPICQGSLFWDLSDIYEETGWHYQPFHGGYGLITINDLPKAGWHAFRLLHEHAGEALAMRWDAAPAGVGALASREPGMLRVLLYHHSEPGSTPAAATVRLAGLPAGCALARLEEVLPGAGSAYETWIELGRPTFATRELLERLEAASRPRRRSVDPADPLRLAPGTFCQLSIPLAG